MELHAAARVQQVAHKGSSWKAAGAGARVLRLCRMERRHCPHDRHTTRLAAGLLEECSDRVTRTNYPCRRVMKASGSLRAPPRVPSVRRLATKPRHVEPKRARWGERACACEVGRSCVSWHSSACLAAKVAARCVHRLTGAAAAVPGKGGHVQACTDDTSRPIGGCRPLHRAATAAAIRVVIVEGAAHEGNSRLAARGKVARGTGRSRGTGSKRMLPVVGEVVLVEPVERTWSSVVTPRHETQHSTVTAWGMGRRVRRVSASASSCARLCVRTCASLASHGFA